MDIDDEVRENRGEEACRKFHGSILSKTLHFPITTTTMPVTCCIIFNLEVKSGEVLAVGWFERRGQEHACPPVPRFLDVSSGTDSDRWTERS